MSYLPPALVRDNQTPLDSRGVFVVALETRAPCCPIRTSHLLACSGAKRLSRMQSRAAIHCRVRLGETFAVLMTGSHSLEHVLDSTRQRRQEVIQIYRCFSCVHTST